MDDYQAIYEATTELSRLLLEETDLADTLLSIGQLAVSVIPSCEEAGVTLENHGRATMRVSTGAIAESVDANQYEIEEGPCVAAADQHRPVLIENMFSEERWPRFSTYAAAKGVKSSYALPMIAKEEMIGVLNLYSIDGPFGPADEQIGVRFADQAGMAVRRAATFNKTKEMLEHLHRALESRDIIGAAVGIMMHRDGSTMDVALTKLKQMSQHENLKLRDVAERLISQFQPGDSVPSSLSGLD